MWGAVAGITVPIVGAIVAGAWRLSARLSRLESALLGPNDATLSLARQNGLVWVVDARGAGHWLREASVPEFP